MSTFLPNDPSWHEIDAQEYILEKPSDEIILEFKKIFPETDFLYKVNRNKNNKNSDTFPGHYLLTTDKKLFIKVVDENEHNFLIKAAPVTDFLYKKGLSTFTQINESAIKISGFYLYIYPYIDNRFAQTTPEDINKISLEISKMHSFLKDIDNKELIIAQAQKREKTLKENFNEKIELFKEIDPRAYDYLSKYADILDKRFGNEQIVHGDINYHNIIFDKSNGKAVILDFEYSVYSYFSPIFDIAKVLERFILLKDISNSEKIKLGKILIETAKVEAPASIYGMLLFISVHSLLILANIYYNKKRYNIKEINKFKNHIKFIEENKQLINDIIF